MKLKMSHISSALMNTIEGGLSISFVDHTEKQAVNDNDFFEVNIDKKTAKIKYNMYSGNVVSIYS